MVFKVFKMLWDVFKLKNGAATGLELFLEGLNFKGVDYVFILEVPLEVPFLLSELINKDPGGSCFYESFY